jgi:predicted ATPase/DNA-binding SARP family transcriptional activator
MVTMLHLRALSAFEAHVDGAPVERFRSEKARALLVYLAVEPDHQRPRAHLAALLWPDHSDESALRNLSQTLVRLNEALGEATPPYLLVTRQTIGWNAQSHAAFDVTCLTRLAQLSATADLEQAAALYRGAFLPGFSIPDCEEFDDWLRLTREGLERLALDVLARLAERYLAAGQCAEAVAVARRQLELDAWREAAHRQLMRALALSGARAAALAAYARCREALLADLGLEPDDETQALYERIRSGDAPMARPAGGAPRDNLPAALTPFVGRDAELAELVALRQQPGARLLTLVGAGGMGKTRLALEAASAARDAYADGVWFVGLAALATADGLPVAIARAISATLDDADPPAALLSVLRDKQMLLVLDNFEHLLDGASLVVAIMQGAPRVQIMATSREQLNVRGEQLYRVRGLAYPAREAAGAAQSAAVQLFVEGARRAQAGFTLRPDDLPAVLRICRLVEGMPLGLELAAAWTGALPLAQIAGEIESSADFLATDWVDAPARQRSMRAVFAWSWGLLDEATRSVFCRLSVFRGGFTREAAEPVAGASLRALTSLLHKSLLRWTEPSAPHEGRYEMHELLRQFAAEQLALAGEGDAVRGRHLAFFAGFAAEGEPALFSADQTAWLVRFETEHDNLGVALDWARDSADGPTALQLTAALWSFWNTRGHYQEGRRRLLEALSLPTAQAPTAARAKALNAFGALLWTLGDAAEARPLLDEALTIGRAINDPWNIGWALLHQGMIAYQHGDHLAARPLLEAGLAGGRAAGAAGRRSVGWALIFLGDLALDAGAQEDARRYFEESIATLRALSDRALVAYPLRRLGRLALQQGDYERAALLCHESLQLNLAIRDRVAVAACLAGQAAVAAARGQAATAADRVRYLQEAALHCGAVAAQLAAVGMPLWPADATAFDGVTVAVRAALDAPLFLAAWSEGQAMTLERLQDPGPALPPRSAQEAGARAAPQVQRVA